jgi:hypothetical protein
MPQPAALPDAVYINPPSAEGNTQEIAH